ncbi:hypothetical protein ACOMHN_025882 [Nucella lapillus]
MATTTTISVTTAATPPAEQPCRCTLPSIDNPPSPARPPRSPLSPSDQSASAGRGRKRSTSKSGGSRSQRHRAAEKSRGTRTSDNRWTASDIAAYFGFDPNKTPSASSVFPSSRFGESYASRSGAESPKSFNTALQDADLDHHDFPDLLAPGRARSRLDTWGSCMSYHYEADYEEKKARVLKGKLGQKLSDYFPDLKAATKRRSLPQDSEDEAYDTDLDDDLGSELLAAERCQADQELGTHPQYKRQCQKQQVVPNTYFLRHLHDEHLHLSFRYLSFGDSYTLAKEIENQPSITRLDLEDNAMGSAGMMCFADMLKKNSYIHQVNLSDNNLGVIGARLLKNVLLKNGRLVSVNVSGNGFGERGAKYLADVIDRNDTIKHLYIAHNAIGDVGAALIGRALGNNVTLRTLDLSWNHIRKKGALGLSKGLKHSLSLPQANCTLETLLLAMNGLHVEGTRLLMTSLRGNDSLRELDLSANRVDREGVRWVASGWPHLPQLTTLKLAFNPVTSEGAEQVVKALMSSPVCQVRYVDLEGVTLEDCFQLLAEELLQQRQDSKLRLLYTISPSSRERSTDLPVDTLAKVTDLMEEQRVDLRDLFQDVPEDDQLILSTQELFTRLQKSGKVSDPHRVARLKQHVHRDLRRRFLLKDLLMLSSNRRHLHLEALHGAQAVNTPELREVQSAWRYPRPHSSSLPSPMEDVSNPRTPDVLADKLETLQTSLYDVRE